ncbi:Mov34/MPN/PAD-1 family protein, partial [Actinomadura luteofluorescens]
MTEWGEEALARLRAAAHRGFGDAGLLQGRPLGPVLQYAGDVLVAALEQGRDVRSLALACLDELNGRALPGDAELADEVAAALGVRAPTGLVPLPVDLGAVAAAMEMDDRDEEPVVIYHSHTATEAYPSRTDISYA